MEFGKASVVGIAAFAMLALTAAGRPVALTQTQTGLWEFSRTGAARPERVCLADVSAMAQLQHRRSRCTRVVIRDLPSMAEIHYTCTGGGFGRTTLRPITPRSVKVETQGISDGAPFNYTLQGRRVGECPR